jgi:hypothetical protein
MLLGGSSVMAFKILDGRGQGHESHVNQDNQLVVRAISQPDIEFVSEEKGRAFSWTSTFTTGGANQEIISIKNTDTTRDLVIKEIVVSSSVNQVWTLFEVTSGTATGTTITAQNLNLGSGKVASSTAFGNAEVTGSLSGNNLLYACSPAVEEVELDIMGSLILGLNDEIAITASSAGTVYATVLGFYVNPEEL